MNEQVMFSYQDLVQKYQDFGREHVFEHKLSNWNKMVEEKVVYHPTALQAAVYAMEDLDSGVDYTAIYYGIVFMCRKQNSLAVTQQILLEYAKKGPDFLLKTGAFNFKNSAKATKRCKELLKEAQEENNLMEQTIQKQ